jgi:hypothetical protein
MATSPSRVAWDSSTWIAHIQRERIFGPDGKAVIEDRGAMCRPVLDAAERGIIEIVVSAMALVEVLARNRTSGVDDQRVRDFFDNDYILLVNVDKHLGDFARRLMLAGHSGLKPQAGGAKLTHLRLDVWPPVDTRAPGISAGSWRLENSASILSPVFFTIRPRCSLIFGLISWLRWVVHGPARARGDDAKRTPKALSDRGLPRGRLRLRRKTPAWHFQGPLSAPFAP